jgi:hypothetical protein
MPFPRTWPQAGNKESDSEARRGERQARGSKRQSVRNPACAAHPVLTQRSTDGHTWGPHGTARVLPVSSLCCPPSRRLRRWLVIPRRDVGVAAMVRDERADSRVTKGASTGSAAQRIAGE